MKLQTIDSGSQGNCHILTASNGDIFIIELGVQEKLIKQAINFDISSVVGAFVSHRHQDHARSQDRFCAMGIPIIAPYRDNVTSRKCGDFKCKCFPLVHDVPCFGLYLEHPEIDNLLYICDTSYCAYDFSKMKVRHLMIEANYETSKVDVEAPNFEHKIKHHQSLETCLNFIRHNNSPYLRDIVIVHTNPNTIDEEKAIKLARNEVDYDVGVYIGHAGLNIELKKEVSF